MMLQLILHTSPEPLRKGVGGHCITRGLKLCHYEIRLIFRKHFLRLMGRCDNDGTQESRQKYGGNPYVERKHAQHDKVMGEECV